MKHLKNIFNALRGVFLTAIITCPTPVLAQDHDLSSMDSVEISLLTCQPHDEVYSLYGHTAIRYHELTPRGIDAAFNYGVFNYDAPLFVARFVFGLTDYELGAYPYDLFQREYHRLGCMVTEQVLNLTNEEKQQLKIALSENLRPENKIYRYNYFYNNCTTQARDIIERCINGKVQYPSREDFTPSYRDMIHEMTRQNPWSRFGNDLLLGIQADCKTNSREQEFLPHNLLYDFDHAQIYANDSLRPLVKERRIAVPAGVQIQQEGFPLKPIQCGLILLAVGFLLFLIQWKLHRTFLIWEVFLMLLSGIVGIVLFLMLFSQHPTVRINLQILFFNPIHLIYLYPIIRHKPNRYWIIVVVLCLLFLIGGLSQSYAEGIWNLALCLLLQSILHSIMYKKNNE